MGLQRAFINTAANESSSFVNMPPCLPGKIPTPYQDGSIAKKMVFLCWGITRNSKEEGNYGKKSDFTPHNYKHASTDSFFLCDVHEANAFVMLRLSYKEVEFCEGFFGILNLLNVCDDLS